MEFPITILRKKPAEFRPLLAEMTHSIKNFSPKNKIPTQNSRNTFPNFYVKHWMIKKKKHHICATLMT